MTLFNDEGQHTSPPYHSRCSRRQYYQQLYLKRLVLNHRRAQPLPEELEVELEVSHVE